MWLIDNQPAFHGHQNARVEALLRTRPGDVIDGAPMPAVFEIDGLGITEQEGWSVLVRGILNPVAPDAGEFRERFDAQPWLDNERDAWLIIEPFSITGRRLRSLKPQWAFHFPRHL